MEPPRYLIIGRVLKPWSYRGELKIEILTEFPKRFASLRQVYIGDDAKLFPVERARLHGKYVLLKLAGVDSTQEAAKLRDQLVCVAREEAVPLSKGKHYIYELIGLRVLTTDGELLGEITEVLDTGANDVYIVKDNSREILIPATEEVVKEIAVERGEIVVKLIEGLI
jgi:16S rRNA processing protein RimM